MYQALQVCSCLSWMHKLCLTYAWEHALQHDSHPGLHATFISKRAHPPDLSLTSARIAAVRAVLQPSMEAGLEEHKQVRRLRAHLLQLQLMVLALDHLRSRQDQR